MKLRDPKLKENVDVLDKGCFTRTCYWPRPDPGQFTQGRGYSTRHGGNKGWLCGEREARGCPTAGACRETGQDGLPCNTAYVEKQERCSHCGRSIKAPEKPNQ